LHKLALFVTVSGGLNLLEEYDCSQLIIPNRDQPNIEIDRNSSNMFKHVSTSHVTAGMPGIRRIDGITSKSHMSGVKTA